MTKALQLARALVPELSPSLHKGQAGRLGVVGGSKDYTGAPFFSAMAAMRIGVDLAHIICEPKAGDVIKTYAPDLIVHRVLDQNAPIEEIHQSVDDVVSRLHVLVVGPGLGRDDHMQACAGAAISIAKKRDIGLVIDADGLWFVNNNIDAIKGYKKAILTPNVMEMKRLCEKLSINPDEVKEEDIASKVSELLGGVTVLEKGGVDRITNGSKTLTVDASGSLKRCGGQGDILSGAAGTLLAWGSVYAKGIGSDKDIKVPHEDIPLYAAYGASTFTRECSRLTFEEKGRSMITQDMLKNLIQAGSFIEYATFSNNYYDIDAQGVKIIKDKHQNLQPTFVFLSPPSIDSLARRLVKRGSETEESLRSRLDAAKGEMEYAQTGAFDYVIVNDDIEQAYEKLRKVALGEGTESDILPDNRIA
ncbi:hypothetical protein E3Q23_00398 [Wallemia mellicola]|uniref:ATP-dependent (S)-NAD(P)H-hydrate dehydratase n=1 Tax=Wallemia mellicola TaxID=1708541 RepID=A0A4T0MLN2_9BASI|nr:hypothetical protein E3Q24_02174 [Wallemia mellicola]TIB79208.1 hypothetical protein E3Q23_00398 [Wallemia mellicola]TIB84301.1 Ribokinase-like protein [Wallemia mellicola]TIB87525.1 Ribokinase-like protein [Wallemia mellicola]TIB92004.1 Ribokinase-like protein [Wallemia mellicola]